MIKDPLKHHLEAYHSGTFKVEHSQATQGIWCNVTDAQSLEEFIIGKLEAKMIVSRGWDDLEYCAFKFCKRCDIELEVRHMYIL